MRSFNPLMTLCHTSLGFLSSRVLILGSHSLSLLRLPIFSHLHTIPFERCVFLYAFVFGASINFPHLVLRSLNEVHRSSVVGHALIHPIFIHRILLFLGLDGFPSGEPVHVVAPIGATFLKQRAAHMRAVPSRPRGASSSAVPPPPSSTGADDAETSGAAAVGTDVSPLTTSDDSDI